MASSEQVGTKEGDEVGESPSPGLLSLASLLEHSLAILQGLQKPRSILKRGFSVNKAMKSNQVFIECKVSSPARDQLQTKEGGWTQGHPPNTRSLPASCISFRVGGGRSIPGQRREIPMDWLRFLCGLRKAGPTPCSIPCPSSPSILNTTRNQAGQS